MIVRGDLKRLAVLGGLVLVVVLAGVFVGEGDLSVQRVGAALLGQGEAIDRAIVWELRAPRVTLALIVGAGLGAAGAVLQGYFRNPLADPGVVGAAPAASLGAVAALYFGWSEAHPLAASGAALLSAAIGMGLLFALVGEDRRPSTLILAGVAISSASGALVALAMNLSPNPWALAEIAYWLMGSVRDRGWAAVLTAGPLILLGLAIAVSQAGALNAYSLGETTAGSLGFDRATVMRAVVVASLLLVAPGVAAAGVVGFVGLAAPHLVRRAFDAEPGRLLAPAALVGAGLVVAADVAAHLVGRPGAQLHLGVVTALLGAPFFLALVLRTRRSAP